MKRNTAKEKKKENKKYPYKKTRKSKKGLIGRIIFNLILAVVLCFIGFSIAMYLAGRYGILC